MESVILELDILYMMCVQKECFDELEYVYIKLVYILMVVYLSDVCSNLKVLYLLLWVDEIIIDVDKILYVYYFE